MHMIISSLSKLEEVEAIPASDFQEYSLPDLHKEKWQVLRLLLRLPWLRRLWVQQELALAKIAHILWGLTLFEWDILNQALYHMMLYDIDSTLHEDGIIDENAMITVNQINNMSVLRNNTLEKKKVRLIDLIYNARGADVTDPRDKIYSVLGLTVDVSDLTLYVNYSESTSTVYKRVGQRLVEKYGRDQHYGTRLLYLSTGLRDGLTSWEIDWNVDFFHMGTPFGGTDWYHATEDTLPKMGMGKDDTLVVAASKFDPIEKVTSSLTRDFMLDWDDFCEREAEAHALIDDLPTYPTHEPSMHAYSTTLIADSHRYQKLDGSAITNSYTAFFTPLSDDRAIEAERSRREESFRIRCSIVAYRRFCITKKGYFGLVPAKAQVGDLVCLLPGGDAPIVLRKDVADGQYIYISDGYVHGIMNGEAMKQDDFHVEDFVIK